MTFTASSDTPVADSELDSAAAPWRDVSLPTGERVEALLAEMTLPEKVAQLGSVWLGFDQTTGDVAPMQNVFSRASSFAEATADGLGQLTRVFGTGPVTPAEGVARVHELQRTLMSSTRLGLPAVVHEECLTGFTTYQATVYPGSLAWAASFDPELVHAMASAIGRDMAAVGVHQGLSPVLDVVRDHRWGRVEETMGEDPYLVSQVGSAYVRGLEENGIIATLKHFAGYAASKAARNHAPVSVGPRELADVILPPFEHAVRYAGVRSVMNSYTDIDGVPVASDVVAAHRGAARPVGLRRHGGLRLRGRGLPAAHAPDRRDRGGRRGVRADRRAGRRAAQHPLLRPAAAGRDRRRPGRRGPGRPVGPAGARAEGRARAAGPGLDPRGHRDRRRARHPRQPRHRPAAGRGERRPAGQPPTGSCRWPPTVSCGSPSSDRAPTTRRPSSAATPSPTT